MQVLLAQHGETGSDESLAISIVALVAMLIPVVVLGVVSWIFWKAKRRDDAEKAREREWKNAPSS
jgi:heme/copper-type cytochrome/quinol oxidase subunit 2